MRLPSLGWWPDAVQSSWVLVAAAVVWTACGNDGRRPDGDAGPVVVSCRGDLCGGGFLTRGETDEGVQARCERCFASLGYPSELDCRMALGDALWELHQDLTRCLTVTEDGPTLASPLVQCQQPVLESAITCFQAAECDSPAYAACDEELRSALEACVVETYPATQRATIDACVESS